MKIFLLISTKVHIDECVWANKRFFLVRQHGFTFICKNMWWIKFSQQARPHPRLFSIRLTNLLSLQYTQKYTAYFLSLSHAKHSTYGYNRNDCMYSAYVTGLHLSISPDQGYFLSGLQVLRWLTLICIKFWHQVLVTIKLTQTLYGLTQPFIAKFEIKQKTKKNLKILILFLIKTKFTRTQNYPRNAKNTQLH